MKVISQHESGEKISCSFGDFKILAESTGEAFPESFDYFIASLAMCKLHFARAFCQTRDIQIGGLKIEVENYINGDEKKIDVRLTLPSDFPDKYQKAIIASIKNCTVKKWIEGSPEFDYQIN